ncbi:ABC transporter permease [Paenibacillus sp. sgz500958]|uniref:ABC transporter permease n=1 Tax=Paenibacillus sp. sgz500958 TaxID=3242475 RepID=UPI0036D42192
MVIYLFGTDDPIGQKVQLNGISYKVVGLLETKGSSLGGSNDDKILIPISTAERQLQSKGVRSITVATTSADTGASANEKLESNLNA